MGTPGSKASLVTSSLRRNAALGRLMVSSGRRMALLKTRRSFASANKKAELNSQAALKTAEDVTKTFGQMKGAMMKLGQMASYLDSGLPENARNSLATLQADAPPMAPELAEAQIEAELGAKPQDIFAEWNPIPIAAASIGQVHSAVTRDGHAVAVKVQYPEIGSAVASDLKKANWMFTMLGALYPGVDPEPIVNEIRDRLEEELDYEAEAENQRFFGNYFEGHPFINVPRVFDELSTKRIITSELVVGSKFSEVLSWSQKEKNDLAETIFRFSFGAIYQLNAFNGDPHPGNYIFHKGGKVTFLDYGLVKKFQDSEVDLFEVLINHMVLNPDKEKFRAAVDDAGILSEASREFSTDHLNEYFRYFYEYVIEDRDLTIDESYSQQGVARLFDMKGEFGPLMKTLNVPPSMVIVQRITLGLMGIFGQLSARGNWQRISKELWPSVEQEPSTPMSQEIAKWAVAKL